MAERIHAFRNAGGIVLKPPHNFGVRNAWLEEAEDYYQRFKWFRANRPGDPRFDDPRLDTGLDYLRKALRQSSCIVAVHNGEAVAALSFGVKAGKYVNSSLLGSRQDPRGAGTSIEMALAEIASVNKCGVVVVYIPNAL